MSLSGEQDVDIGILNIRFVGCCEIQVLVLYQDDFVPVDGRAPIFEYMQVLFEGAPYNPVGDLGFSCAGSIYCDETWIYYKSMSDYSILIDPGP